MNTVKRRSLWMLMLIISGLLLQVAPAAAHHQYLSWDNNGTSFARFGPNASVIIHTGTLEWACDTFMFASNVYVVPSGSVSVGSTLEDVSGTPNTIQTALAGGLFENEIIGFTAPSGTIGAGTYAVVYDECQNGKFDAGVDKVFDPAFEVTIPVDVPNLPSGAFAQIKADAAEQAQKAQEAAALFAAIMIAYDVYNFTNLGTGYQRMINFYLTYVCSLPMMAHENPDIPITWNCPTVSVQDTIRLQLAATKVLLDEGSHWEGIAADPPDPNFVAPSTFSPLTSFQPYTNDEVEQSLVELGRRITVNAAASKSLLASMEKYQGAQLEGDGAAALMHARNIQRDARLLAANLTDTNGAIDTFEAQLNNSGRDLEGLFDDLKIEQDRVKANGLSVEEQQMLGDLGFTDSGIDGVEAAFKAFPATRFRDLGGIDATLNALKTQSNATVAALQNFASAMDANVNALVAAKANTTPLANAGGPYIGTEGTALTLNASGSSDPGGKTLTYAWDLDSDGEFDDATGANPTHVFGSGYTGLVGVKVTNSVGRYNVAYAPVTIGEANRPAVVTSVTPSNNQPINLEVGASRAFTAVVSDPDNDSVAIKWQVNDADAGTGANFSFTPAEGNLGINVVTVRVSDNQTLGGATELRWVVLVKLPDADGDGWRANKDCDDTDPAVNPGQTEIVGNGKDDDCDPRTSDAGGPPNAFFNPQSGGRNVALHEGGATIHSFSSQSSTSNTPQTMIDYGSSVGGWRTNGKANQWVIIGLAEGKTYQIDRIKIMPGTGSDALRTFEIAVANSAAGPYITVLSGTTTNTAMLQEFTLPEPVQAKYVRLTPLTNHGASCCIAISQFKVFTGQEGQRSVTFNNLSVDSENDVVAWHWNFGDGTTSTEKNPIHNYPATSATYNVTLTATDAQGNNDSYSLSQRVLLPPIANFTVSPTTPNEGASATYTDTSTDPDGQGMLATRTWIWPDNVTQIASTVATSRAIENSGSRVVKLQVVDRQEQVSTIERTITVLNVPPTVNVGADQTVLWGQGLATSSFSVSDLSNADEQALICTWNFGDGTTTQLAPCTTSAARIPHAYANPGTYTATLTATDPDGGTKSDSLVVTVKKRDTLVQPLNVRNIAGGQVEITAKLFERHGWTVVPNESITFTAGTATTSAKTGTGGTATVTLPRAVGVEKVGVSMSATTHYNPSAMERVIDAPLGDIIFIVDESGSMSGDQDDIRRHLTAMTEQLASKVDFRLGVVGFGSVIGTHGTKRHGEGHIEQALTNEIGPVARAIDSLEADGNFEAGFDATKVAMSDAMSFRQNAGTCAIMITDDFADLNSTVPTTREQAVAALKARNAVFLGIINPNITRSADDYGPNPGSLAAETGGQVWNITDFRKNPQPVLDAVLQKCLASITQVDLTLTKTDGQATAPIGDSLTYTLTVNNVSTGLARSVALIDTLPAGTSFVGASNGGTFANGKVTWPAFDLTAGETATRTVTVKLTETLSVGAQLVNNATVADDGTSGPDRTPGNNAASDSTTVEAAPNQAPVAHNQSVTTSKNVATAITLGATDADGNTLTYTIASQPARGTLSGSAPNLSYTPSQNYHGTDSFTFKVSDGTANSNVATVSITINNVNAAPEVNAGGPYTVAEGGAIHLVAEGSDPDGDTLIYGWDLNNDGTFETPGQSVTFSAMSLDGPDSRTVAVRVTDGGGLTATAQATISIANVAPTADLANDGPTAEGSPATITFSKATDPSSADSQVGLQYAFACDGTTFGMASTQPETTCTFDDGPKTYTVRGRVLDKDGAATEYSTEVEVTNVAPTATFVLPADVIEGGSFTLALTGGSDPSKVDQAGLKYAFDCGNGSWSNLGSSSSILCAAGNGELTVKGKVQDKDGASTQYSATIVADSLPPSLDAPVITPFTSSEGESVIASVNFTQPGSVSAPYSCTVDYGDGSGPVTGAISGMNCTGPTHTYADNGAYPITLTIRNSRGASGSSVTTHTVNNVAPIVGAITTPLDPSALGKSINFQSTFNDPGVLDTHSAQWDWGDGTNSIGVITGSNGSGSVAGNHTYAQAGVYRITLWLQDKDGDWGSAISNYVVIYDPSGGFVTGGGWIESPAGAYTPDPTLTGRASFGFVAKYKKGATTPTGQTQFQFQAGDLNFHSDSYEWLVVAGARAQYKGVGTINGQSGFGFMITAIDGQIKGGGGVDKFRIKIWDTTTGNIIYDNQLGASNDATPTTSLSNGSIVIHSSK